MEFQGVQGFDFFLAVVNFSIMFYIFRLVCIKPMLEAVKLRHLRVQKRLDEIEQVLEEARATEATYKAQFEKLAQETENIKAIGDKETVRVRERILKEAEADAHHLVEKAKLEAEKARRLALADLQGQIARAAMVEAEKQLTQAFDKDSQTNIAENFLVRVGETHAA